MDFSNYKFRCSTLKELMTNPRSKSEALSETTKGLLYDIFVEETYNRKREISNKYLEKGNYAEEDSLTLVTNQTGKLFVKNKETLENDFIKGTPDIIKPDGLDIKSCWDIHTFIRKNEKVAREDYYLQLWGYMWLTGLTTFKLVYTLVNSPEHLIVSAKTRRMYAEGIEDGSEEMAIMEEEIEREMKFDDIAEEKRLKIYEFAFNTDLIAEVQNRVVLARNYLNKLSLN